MSVEKKLNERRGYTDKSFRPFAVNSYRPNVLILDIFQDETLFCFMNEIKMKNFHPKLDLSK